MRIRLSGTPAECDAAAAIISTVLDVVDEYTAYQHRPRTRVVVYLNADILARPDRKDTPS